MPQKLINVTKHNVNKCIELKFSKILLPYSNITYKYVGYLICECFYSSNHF